MVPNFQFLSKLSHEIMQKLPSFNEIKNKLTSASGNCLKNIERFHNFKLNGF